MSEQQRARALRATIEREIPANLDLWPTIRRRVATPARRGAARTLRRWRPLAPLLATSLLVMVLLGTALLRPSQAPSVGAAEIISQARAASKDGGLSYHLAATYRNAPANLAWENEHWQAADGRLVSASTGINGEANGLIDTGSEAWFYLTEAGQTTVQYIPQSKAAIASAREAITLEQWLGSDNGQGCSTARREADEVVAGRSAYVISIASTGTCSEVGEAGDRSLVWLDQETYLLIGTAYYTPDGALREQYTVTAIEYGPVPESIFAYTPPAGATVCALKATPGYTLCQGEGHGRPAPNGPTLEPSVARAASDAQFATLGLTPEQFKRALGGGKTIADLAQERSVTPVQLREAMHAADQTRLDTLVAEGAITPEEASAQQTLLTDWLDAQFNDDTPTPTQP
jgi:outer membrane lipoprotein-sorting protein